MPERAEAVLVGRESSSSPQSVVVFEERCFNELIIRERKRANRSDRALMLLCVDVTALSTGWGAGGFQTNERRSVSEQVSAALAQVKRKGDVLGWYDQDAVLGLLAPGLSPSDAEAVCAGLVRRVRQAVAERLDAPLPDGTVHAGIYPEPKRPGSDDPWPVDPMFYPERCSGWNRRGSYDRLKRALDVLGSLVLLIGLAPLFLLVAALVGLTSRGPVFFKQVRIGLGGQPFTMLKFRSMYAQSEHRLHQDYVRWFISSSGACKGTGAQPRHFKLTDDPRITPVGRFLRKTSLDELPQLWNVLRGDMSLVGPRPALPYELEQYKPWHRHRILDAVPGMTGLWQVFGRSRTTFDEMVRLDLRYARSRSLWTDIKLLLATPAAVLSGKGAG